MGKTFTLLTLLFMVSILWSCKKKKKQQELGLEQTVFYEIFPKILDSVFYDQRIPPPAPPPSTEYYKNKPYKDFEGWMKSDEFKNLMNKWEMKRDSVERDTTSIYLVVYDSVMHSEDDDKEKFIQYLNYKATSTDSIFFSKGFKIDLSKLITNNKKIKFKHKSEFPEGREFWNNNHDYYIAATIGFTRIYFDQSRSYGILNVGFTMGYLNGHGVKVFIRKNNESTWIIDKIEGTWES